MSPIPPPCEWPIAGAFFSSGISVTMTSVVSISPATLDAFCKAQRTTLVGSMMPASNMSAYFSRAASKPIDSFSLRTCSTTTDPSKPAFCAICRIGSSSARLTIVRRALEEPIRQIAQNAGLEGSVVVEHVRKEKESMGFDAATEKYTDMFEAGIIDPTKVVRCALQNAASVAGLMLTTEVMVTEIPEEKKAPAGGHSNGGGMEGMY